MRLEKEIVYGKRHCGRSFGDSSALSYRIRARIALQTAKYKDAMQYLQAAMALYRSVKWLYGEADCYQAQGEVYMGRRDEASAEIHFRKAKDLYFDINHLGGTIFCTRALADIEFRRRHYVQARTIYEQALDICQSEVDKCRALFGIASSCLALHEDIKAKGLYDRVLPVFQHHGNAVPEEAHTLKKLGDMAIKVGDDDKASGLIEQALVKFRLMGVVPAQADCLVRLAEIAVRQQAKKTAVSRYEEAMTLYDEAEDDERKVLCCKELQGLRDMPSRQWVRLL